MSESIWTADRDWASLTTGGVARATSSRELSALSWAREMKADLVAMQQASGIPAAGAVAQMIHESFNPGGVVLSRLAGEFYNFAGLKWATWMQAHGARAVSLSTWEEVDGERVDLDDAFAAFPDRDHFLEAYAELLHFERYRGGLAYAGQPLLWLHQVWAAGYATDSRYLAGLGNWMAATWSIYADTLPAAPIAPGRPVAVLDAAGRRLCEGWLHDPDGPGPEPERTVVRLRDLADAQGLLLEYDPGGPTAYLRWPGATPIS